MFSSAAQPDGRLTVSDQGQVLKKSPPSTFSSSRDAVRQLRLSKSLAGPVAPAGILPS